MDPMGYTHCEYLWFFMIVYESWNPLWQSIGAPDHPRLQQQNGFFQGDQMEPVFLVTIYFGPSLQTSQDYIYIYNIYIYTAIPTKHPQTMYPPDDLCLRDWALLKSWSSSTTLNSVERRKSCWCCRWRNLESRAPYRKHLITKQPQITPVFLPKEQTPVVGSWLLLSFLSTYSSRKVFWDTYHGQPSRSRTAVRYGSFFSFSPLSLSRRSERRVKHGWLSRFVNDVWAHLGRSQGRADSNQCNFHELLSWQRGWRAVSARECQGTKYLTPDLTSPP